MARFTFTRGTWTTGIDLPDSKDNEDFSEYAARIGFVSRRYGYGDGDGKNIELYESNEGGAYYALVSPFGEYFEEVYLPDFPSLMMFIGQFATAFSAEALVVATQEGLDIMRKTFQAGHGHTPYASCPKCDPDGYKEQRRLFERQQ